MPPFRVSTVPPFGVVYRAAVQGVYRAAVWGESSSVPPVGGGGVYRGAVWRELPCRRWVCVPCGHLGWVYRAGVRRKSTVPLFRGLLVPTVGGYFRKPYDLLASGSHTL